MQKSILMLGIFTDPSRPSKNINTVEDKLSEIFAKHHVKFISSSSKSGRKTRLLENIIAIIKNRNAYDIALIPLFGTRASFVLQEIQARLLHFFHKKIVISVHGGSIPAQMDIDPKKFLKALKRAEVIVCPSGFFYQYLSNFDLPLSLIPNAINLDEYFFNKKEKINPKIFWMRVFTDVYNPLMAVRVAEILSKKYPDFQMILAGKDSQYIQQVKQLAQDLNVLDKLTFPGYIDLAKKRTLARDYDVYICTNRIDNAPVSIIEFMALGLPVVAVNIGGIPYLIDNEVNGLLCNDDDAQSMAAQIERLINDNLLAQKIISNAKKYAEGYDEKYVFEKWKNLLNKLGVQTA